MKLTALIAALGLLAACGVAPDPDDHVTQVAEVSVASFHSEHAPSFHIVDDASTYLQRLCDRVAVDRPPDVERAQELWRRPDGTAATEVFLVGPSPDALARVAASAPELAVPAGDQLVYAQLRDGRWRTYLVGPTVLDGSDLRSVAPGLDLELTDAGAQRWGEVTGANVGRRLAIVVDGHVVAAPVIDARITGTHAVVTLDRR
jgi:preprotein translocase subunit SecD